MTPRHWGCFVVFLVCACDGAPQAVVDGAPGSIDAPVGPDAAWQSCTASVVQARITGTTPWGPVNWGSALVGIHTPKGGPDQVNVWISDADTLLVGPNQVPRPPASYMTLSPVSELTTQIDVPAHISVDGHEADIVATVTLTLLDSMQAPMAMGSLTTTGDYQLAGTFSADYCMYLDTAGI